MLNEYSAQEVVRQLNRHSLRTETGEWARWGRQALHVKSTLDPGGYKMECGETLTHSSPSNNELVTLILSSHVHLPLKWLF